TRRFKMYKDILSESWAYQEILKEGLDIGLEQGLEEGNQRMRNITISLIEDHFPPLLDSAKELVQAIKDPDRLQRLLMDVVSAQTLEEAEQIIHIAKNDMTK
ncbi:MAG: hypothetical protein M3Z24_17145, partial [Chloroflexota bacterium]|nr:hypothetical protein [Chloroflexota bacterium]